MRTFDILMAASSEPQDPEERLKQQLQDGRTLEEVDEMTPGYRKVLSETIKIAADLETIVLPNYYGALINAPDIEGKIQAATAIHDEMGHAVLQHDAIDDLIEDHDIQEFVMDRDPEEWGTFYLLEFKLEDWYDFAILQCIGDRAGRKTTVDLEEHCSYNPYSRALQKINFEQNFHVRNGAQNVRRIAELGEEHRERLQESLDFHFPLSAEWFGTTDDKKKRWTQLDYNIRGHTNDEMRQKWLSEVVPFFEEVGLDVPAHYDEEADEYVLEYDYPILMDEEEREWQYDEEASWEEKFGQWKRGGPDKSQMIERIQIDIWGDDLWNGCEDDEWISELFNRA